MKKFEKEKIMEIDSTLFKAVAKLGVKKSKEVLSNILKRIEKINCSINLYNHYKKQLEEAIEDNIKLTELCYLNKIKINEELIVKDIYLSTAEKSLLKDLKNTALGGCCSSLLYLLVKQFGTASTGVAIKTLSGVASKNAILAKIGFGTLATGGLGISGGLAILGIITLTPLIYSKIKNYKDEEFKSIDEALILKIKEMINLVSEITKINIKLCELLDSKEL